MHKIQIVLMCAVCLFFVTSTVTAQKAKNMTNADVVEMVKAALSEQVIITSIRQAPVKDFDLTPTGLIALKKAGVSDAIILILQEVSAPVKSDGDSKAPTDDKEPIVNAVLRQAVISQSGGAISLSSFRKTNGYEQDGTKMYVLEWQAEILIEQACYKAGNAFTGYWQNFSVLEQQPGTLDSLIVGNTIHLNKGTKIRLTGDSILRKTEQGWRIEGLTVKTSQVLVEKTPVTQSSVTIPTETTTNARSFETLSATIEKGEEVVFDVKYNSAESGYLYLAKGTVTVSKTAVTFDFTYGLDDFVVSPDKILDVIDEPQQNARIHIKAAVKNKKGTKESIKDFYFYSPGAVAVGTGPGGIGGSISCGMCDNSMSVLFALLQKVRGKS